MAASETKACEAARAYIRLVNDQDWRGLRQLFAETTDYTGPTGARLSDAESVANVYKLAWSAEDNYPTEHQIENIVPFGDDGCLLEFGWIGENGETILAAVDRFRVDEDGRITCFLPYFASSQLDKIVPRINRLKAMAAAQA
jgi:hypothetical protein